MNNTTNILVVDDSELARMNILNQLKESFEQSNIFLAATIDDAWQLLIKNSIDIVILDIYLPGKNGADLVTDMLKNNKFKDIPIIVVTGTSKSSLIKSVIKKYVHAYLHKPIFKDVLLNAIKEGINKKNSITVGDNPTLTERKLKSFELRDNSFWW